MKSGDTDAGYGPGRDRERNRFPGFISNAEGGVLGTILWDYRYLGLPSMNLRHSFGIRATTTYRREHPQGFVYRAVPIGIQ